MARTGYFEIALPDQRGKCIAVGEKFRTRGIGMIGSMLLACVALIDRKTCMGRLDPLQCIQRLPGLRRRVPNRIERFKILIARAQPGERRRRGPASSGRNPRNSVSNSSEPRQSGPQRNSLSMNQPRMLVVIGSPGACFVRSTASMTIKINVENVRKGLQGCFAHRSPMRKTCRDRDWVSLQAERSRVGDRFDLTRSRAC